MRKYVCAALCALSLVLMAGCSKATATATANSGGSPLGPSPTPTPGGTQVSVNTESEAIGDCSKTIVFVSDQNSNWTATGPSVSFTGSNSDTRRVTVVIRANGTYTFTATPVSNQFTARSVTITVSELKDCTPSTPSPGPYVPQCRDGKDNDGDGKIDFPSDPGCTNPDDDDEKDTPSPYVPQCRDKKDNDGDGKIDFPSDPGCTNPDDDDETDSPTAPLAPTCSLTANPNQVAQGGNVRLSWTSANAMAIIASGDWSGNKALPSGFQDIILAQTKTFTITCPGAPGTTPATDTEVVFVTAPACPTSIDYTPRGGTVTVGSAFSLQVVNWPSGVSCVPYWYSSDPSRIGILGGDSIWTAPNGSRYFAGVNGQGKAIAVGTADLSVQTSIAINSVFKTYTWTAVAASALEALGMRMPEPPLPKYNIYNTPGVCQTLECK